MQGLFIVVLAGCVAAATAVNIKAGGTQRQLQAQARANLKPNPHGIKQDQNGIDPRFNGPRPTGGVLQYTFNRDNFENINPRNPAADWQWVQPEEVDAANGAFVREAPNTIDLAAVPFMSYVLPDAGILGPLADQYEAMIVNKQNISILPGQVLTVNVKFACKTVNVEDLPWSHDASIKPSDDPTLASCGFGIASSDDSALIFSIIASNKGVWSLYERNRFQLYRHPERKQKEFTVFQRLADRSSPSETIDATIRVDRSGSKVEFLVNGEVKHTLTQLGTLNSILDSKEGKDYKDVYTRSRPDLKQTEVQDVQVILGLAKYPDATDPNNPSNPPLRGVRLTSDPNFYDAQAKFDTNEAQKEKVHWGEGATMTLADAKIELSGKRN